MTLQIRTSLGSQPPHRGQDPLQPSSATSTQSDLACGPVGLSFLLSLDLTYPWRSWNFISSQNPLFWPKEDTGLCGLTQPSGGLTPVETSTLCVVKGGSSDCPY